MKRKILLAFGTRPEAIKMAPLVKEFRRRPDKFETVICITGQHRQMLDQVLRLFDIRPDYDLDIMRQGQDLYDVTARILTGMRGVLEEVRPNVVLVHGDTTSSTAAALAAFYRQIPVGHVEAGLRTHDIYSPWPEEMNRQLTGRIATYHFAPTPLSRRNLLAENVRPERITVTGNTVIDALYMVENKIKGDKALDAELEDILSQAGYDVARLVGGRRLVLITGHRRENFGEGFLSICRAIRTLAERHPAVDFVYPMHLNPNVRKPIHEVFGENLSNLGNMFFIEPLEYLSFVYLMEKSTIVLTDSGGSGRGSRIGQTRAGDARHHRASRSVGCGYRAVSGHGLRQDCHRSLCSAGRPRLLRGHEPRCEPLWRRACLLSHSRLFGKGGTGITSTSPEA